MLTVIGAPTTTVAAQPVSRLATWPSHTDPQFRLQPGQFQPPDSPDWAILAGTIATGTRVIPATGHRSWSQYSTLPGHVWSFAGRDACAVGCASWESGATVPESWQKIVNEPTYILSSLADSDPRLEPNEVIAAASQLCLVPIMIPLPSFHGFPMGQIFSTDLGADGFTNAMDSLATDLAEDIGFISHPWFWRWLDLVKDNPQQFQTQWVSRADIQASIVRPEEPSSAETPFSLFLFSLDYSLAYVLHRDCIIASTKALILKRFLQYEKAAREHAFPIGSPLYGTRIEPARTCGLPVRHRSKAGTGILVSPVLSSRQLSRSTSGIGSLSMWPGISQRL